MSRSGGVHKAGDTDVAWPDPTHEGASRMKNNGAREYHIQERNKIFKWKSSRRSQVQKSCPVKVIWFNRSQQNKLRYIQHLTVGRKAAAVPG